MLAENRMFYKFEIVYKYNPDFRLMFDNEWVFENEKTKHMTIGEAREYFESSEDTFVSLSLVEDTLFKSKETALIWIRDWLTGEVEYISYEGWDCEPVSVSVENVSGDENRYIVYEGKNLVAIVKLKEVLYSII